MLSSENENINKKEEEPEAIKAAEEIKKKQRESEQLNVDPEQIMEEEEKRQTAFSRRRITIHY